MDESEFTGHMRAFEDFMEALDDAGFLSEKGKEFRSEMWKRFWKE